MSPICRVLTVCALLITVGCGTGHGTLDAGAGGNQQLAGLISITSPFVGTQSIPFTIIAGGSLATVAGGSNVMVRFEASVGTPFLGGSSALIEVPGTLTNPTTVTGVSPLATLTSSITANVVVILPSGLEVGGIVAIFNPPPGRLVINEVDYDQDGTDTAEFVELYNAGPGPISLSGIEVRLVQGTGGGASVYATIALTNVVLAANDYYVISANAGTVPNTDQVATPITNLIQNGAPDAVGLFDNNTNTLLDAVSYEGNSGAPYTEGTGVPAAQSDAPSTVTEWSLSRTTDGVDTNNNAADFTRKLSTPGTTNTP